MSIEQDRRQLTAKQKAHADTAKKAANKYGKDAAALETKASGYATDAARLQAKIAKAEAVEGAREARKRDIALRAAKRAMQAAQDEQRRIAEQTAATQAQVAGIEAKADTALRAL